MESRQFRRRLMLLTAVLTLALPGCVSQPDPDQLSNRLDRLSIGQTIDQVGAELHASMRRPNFVLQNNAGDMAVFAVSRQGEVVDGDLTGYSRALVFDRGRYIGYLANGSSAAGYVSCLRQVGGRDLLAQRLRALCAGERDPLGLVVPGSSIPRGEIECPKPKTPPLPAGTAQPKPKDESEFARGAKETAFYSLGVILSPILLPAGLATLGGFAAIDEQSLLAQENLALGISGSDVARIMGQPSLTFVMEPASIEVRCFDRKLQVAFCVGLELDRVVWFGSEQLTGGEYRTRRDQN
jgi:hypothetical protein